MTRPIPYPADTAAKGYRFELDMDRIARSDTWALATTQARPWLLMLWSVAWQQVPCGSMSNDDALIAARLGMPLDDFLPVKSILMRGWWVADDGRLYHDTLVERVNEMISRKTAERDRKAAYRARLKGARPAEGPDLSHGTGAGQARDSHGSDTGRDDTGTGTGTGTINSSLLGAHAKIGFAMRKAGVADINTSHPKFLALVRAGATEDEFVAAAEKGKDKGFAYILGIVEGRRTDAAGMADRIVHGPLPAALNRQPGANTHKHAGANKALYDGVFND